MQLAKAALVSTTRDGATIQPPISSEDTKEVHGGLSCEIVSDLCPNPFSHDWHVQPSCQRPNRIPPKRREFSPEQGHTNVPTACPRNLSNIQGAAKHCQPQHPTGFPDVFHIRNFRFGSRTRSLIRQTQKQVPHPR